MIANNLQKILTKVTKTETCWIWNGYISPSGYGRVKVNYKFRHAHRAIYELMVGEVPNNLVMDHLCRNRACVNPNHLEPVTCKENIMRGNGHASVNAKKTHCKNNHEFSPENTYVDKLNKRNCRECGRIKVRKRRALLKGMSYVHA